MEHSIAELAQKINGTVVGNHHAVIEGVTSIDRPKAGCITFISHPRDLKNLEETEVACILVPKQITTSRKTLIQVDNPKLAFARLLAIFHTPRTFSGQISNQAIVSKTALIGKNVTLEPFVYVGERVQLGNGAVIRANSFVDDDVVIGDNTVIHPNVSIHHHSKIGSHVIIHSGVVIGADGFGFVFDGKEQVKLLQVGNVIIEDDVEIGACTTIDRAAIGETIVGQGTKIDNQVQIAHNVQIGKHCAISAQCGISGSTKIGNYVTMGGSVGVADHVEVGDGAMLGANAGIPPGKKIPPKQIWFGQPARPYEEMRKQFGAQLRAHENQEELRELKKKVATLERELETLKANSKV